MRPKDLKTKIFLDSGDPNETKELINSLGFLDGQTTNPTLISKNPLAKKRFDNNEKFSENEIFDFYKRIVTQLSELLPAGSISIEVYADKNTSANKMLSQARKFFKWIPNAHIKFPITSEGLTAAKRAVEEGIRVNMTLCFNQSQAAAVYAATKGAKSGDIFVSPFVGRLDDRHENGMELIKNIIEMYKTGDGHVWVLTASIRSMEHFNYALALESDIITAPYKILKEWAEGGLDIPSSKYNYHPSGLRPIPYAKFDLTKNWQEFDINHELTSQGIERFSEDWNALIQ